MPDYTWFWWKLRPHPRLGTVEIRALDVQASLEDTAALVALTHCLARHAAEAEPGARPAGRGARGGRRSARRASASRPSCPTPTGGCARSTELLDEALGLARAARGRARLRGRARRVSPRSCERGGGAGRQRAAHEIAGMDALLRELTELTATGM